MVSSISQANGEVVENFRYLVVVDPVGVFVYGDCLLIVIDCIVSLIIHLVKVCELEAGFSLLALFLCAVDCILVKLYCHLAELDL